MKNNLLQLFYEKYYNKQDTMYRLPLSENPEDFWKKELRLRKENALLLPLHSFDGHQYYYNRTPEFVKAANEIMALVLEESELDNMEEYAFSSMMDEAMFSSAIEGANSTKERLSEMVCQSKKPKNKDEKMVINNYRALEFVKANLDERIDEDFIEKVGEILTEGTFDEGEKSGFRDGIVQVVSHTGDVVYIAPDAKYVKPMIKELVAYINDPAIHPIEKAAVAHVFFVTVHPFFDGNGRTARALSYAVLLKAGYSMINLVPISGILSAERGKYYKSIMSSQNPENGYDFTYFVEYYTVLLAKTMCAQQGKMKAIAKYTMLVKDGKIDPDSRIAQGAYWLTNEMITTITAEKWKNKFAVSFETARKDLFYLEKIGFVNVRTEGRKMFFDVTS